MASCARCGFGLRLDENECPRCGHAIGEPKITLPPELSTTPPGGERNARRLVVVAAIVAGALAVVAAGTVVLGGSTETRVTRARDAAGPAQASEPSTPQSTRAEPASTTTSAVAAPALRRGDIAVYFTAGTGSSREYMAEYDITLESSSGAVFRYLPASDDLSVVTRFTSASWAKRTAFPLTVDGRLFVIDHGRETFNSSGSELDPDSHAALHGFRLARSSSRITDYAVIGDRFVWRSPRDWDVLAGHTGGDIYTKAFDGDRRRVLDYGAPGNLGELHATDGRLYRITMNSDTDMVLIGTANPATGEMTELLQSYELAPLGARYWHFAVDGGSLWMAGTIVDEGSTTPRVVLYRHRWGTDGAQPVYEGTLAEPGGVASLDADAGRVLIGLIGNGQESFIIYDSTTGEGTMYLLGISCNSAQILVQR